MASNALLGKLMLLIQREEAREYFASLPFLQLLNALIFTDNAQPLKPYIRRLQ